MESQLESFVFQLFTKLNIPRGLPSLDQPLHPEGDIPPLPRIFNLITFSVTYAFLEWM